MLRKICSFVLVVALVLSFSTIGSSAKEDSKVIVGKEINEFESERKSNQEFSSIKELPKDKKEKMDKAFSEKNIDKAIEKAIKEMEKNNANECIVFIDDENYIKLSLESFKDAIDLSYENNDLSFRTASSYEYINHLGNIGGYNWYGGIAWEMKTQGRFMYNGGTVQAVSSTCWGSTNGLGWSSGNFQGTCSSATGTRVTATGTGDFEHRTGIGPLSMVDKSFTAQITIYCNADGSGYYSSSND